MRWKREKRKEKRKRERENEKRKKRKGLIPIPQIIQLSESLPMGVIHSVSIALRVLDKRRRRQGQKGIHEALVNVRSWDRGIKVCHVLGNWCRVAHVQVESLPHPGKQGRESVATDNVAVATEFDLKK